ncbi:aquaporin family protein [Lactobacillus sp. ESL0791]|uniref:MIP/aquaporin family protein n=1 Tax=Lactobacillus sp. ESL0791 TaxID=2983234 RepID=UPI0023F8110D|nr:MIP/aquaporin family protein [Lactobacillus sp. ESL0791]MDF7638194.1 aquaporin family protein [Lactobacillus sp. ESL0791]
MNGFIGEFLGSMIFILLGVGVCAGQNLQKANARNSSWLYMAISWGLALTMGVYVAGTFGSQGHLNPAVTIGQAIFGFFPWAKVFPYLAGQFLGAFVGAALVILHYYPHFKASKNEAEGNHVGVFATRPAINAPFWNFVSETIGTFAFIFVLLNLGDFTQGLKPFICGITLAAVGAALGSTTGFALNPARDWSPRLVYTILPVPNRGNAEWRYAWVPMFGPLVGGILAAGLKFILK